MVSCEPDPIKKIMTLMVSYVQIETVEMIRELLKKGRKIEVMMMKKILSILARWATLLRPIHSVLATNYLVVRAGPTRVRIIRHR